MPDEAHRLQEDPFQDDVETILESGRSAVRGLRFQAVETRFWDEIPDQVLARMVEFPSVVEEYRLTFQREPPEGLIEPAPYLTLDDFFKLA
jgi:hypothetical protein